MIKICVASHKGGQGKSFISAILCRELSLHGKVLAISICSQNNIHLYLGGIVGVNQLYQAIDSNILSNSIIKTEFDNIDLVPYNINDSLNVDKLLQTLTAGELRIKNLLKQVVNIYDYVVLDTGPNLNISTVGAIIASDFLISPTLLSWSGINGYIATINALNEMIQLELTDCKNLGLIRNQTNVLRDSEAFEVEEHLENNKFPELGNLPFSSALKTALYNFTDFEKVRKDHFTEVRNLFDNIKSKIA